MGTKTLEIQRGDAGRLTGELRGTEIHDAGTKVSPKGDYYSLLKKVSQSVLQVMSSTVFLK